MPPRQTWIVLPLILIACGGEEPEAPLRFADEAALGRALFLDPRLSALGTQSCATCHAPDEGFVDPRPAPEGTTAVSVGDDGVSLGDRNAPTVAYAAYGLDAQRGRRERFNSQRSVYEGFLGGQFLDGRAADLEEQAGGPPLNPIEMGMPDEASVVARLRTDPDYVGAFEAFFGEGVFDDDLIAYRAMTEAIATFERTDEVSPFDSRYDRFLEDPAANPLSFKESLGRSLFFSETDTNCATCHQARLNSSREEIFATGEYHNVGVPVNESARAANGLGPDFVDHGLMEVTGEPADDGKFKVPTLRNVAVTGPYMHNGVFQDLRTVILFYDQHFTTSTRDINPETGEPWAPPEVEATVNLEELRDGGPLDDAQIEALECFLRTLTDARYEALVVEDGLRCADE